MFDRAIRVWAGPIRTKSGIGGSGPIPLEVVYDGGRWRDYWLKGHCPKGQGATQYRWARLTYVTVRMISSARPDASLPIVGVVACVMIAQIRKLIVLLVLTLASACLSAEEMRPRSILVLDQSDLRGPFYYQVFSELRAVVTTDARAHTSLYTENLDLSRFRSPAHEQSLQRYLREKYSDRPIGVIVAVGAATPELVLRWREELWPGIPVVFAMVDDMDYARLKLPPDVTGTIVKLGLADTIAAARAVVLDLRTIVFVGDAWDRQVIFRNWDDEIRRLLKLSTWPKSWA